LMLHGAYASMSRELGFYAKLVGMGQWVFDY
jgi:hypothetical protein